MLAIVRSCALHGIDAFEVSVEVDVAGGNHLPSYRVVGLPAASIREGSDRIRSAIEHVGQEMPRTKIIVNLAPADRRKEGAAFDLPIAVAVLAAAQRAPLAAFSDLLLLGELGLDGAVRNVRGGLAAGLLARERGMRGVLLPTQAAREAAEVEGIEVYGVEHLSQVIGALRGEIELLQVTRNRQRSSRAEEPAPIDMSDVRGQAAARFALEVAVAGGHNVLLVGPPGIGKTMLARRVPTILPPLSREEALSTTKIYSSVAMAPGGLIQTRPFRAPHHTASAPALLGGGSPPRAGEISLAHNGVLFLDELPEFNRATLECLRQPLEDRQIAIGRVHGTIELPASFLLVASANPCPCGWAGSRQRACTCSPSLIERYRAKLSGPLLDRIDMHVFVANLPLADLRRAAPGESSRSIRERVLRARERQRERLEPLGFLTNADMSSRALRRTCVLDAAAERTLERLHRASGGMTGRGVDRLIRVARTIADLSGAAEIDSGALLEAATYRSSSLGPAVGARELALASPVSGEARR